jgi:RHS repeat-associated protein
VDEKSLYAGSLEVVRFTGHERDLRAPEANDDLDYMHARYYNPYLGRFLSVDPVGGEVGSSQSWNRYSYVRNNPIRFVDPQGQWVKLAAGGDSAALEAMLVKYVTRPSGRAQLEKYASSASQTVRFSETTLNNRARQDWSHRTTGLVRSTRKVKGIVLYSSSRSFRSATFCYTFKRE